MRIIKLCTGLSEPHRGRSGPVAILALASHDENVKIEEKIHGRADVIIGKGGVSEGVLEEIRGRLEREGVVKVKVLRSFSEGSESVADLVARAVGAEIVDVRGRTFVLRRPRRG